MQNIDFLVTMSQDKVKVGEANGITIFAFDANITGEHIPVKDVEFEISYKNIDRQGQNRSDTGMLENLVLKDPDGIGVNHIFEIRLKNKPEKLKTVNFIFTVLTSPDSPNAQMWGHMPESVNSPTGLSIKRPLLDNEVKATHSIITENNEKWAIGTVSNAEQYICPANTPSTDDWLDIRMAFQLVEQFGWPSQEFYLTSAKDPDGNVFVADVASLNLYTRSPDKSFLIICK